MRKCSNCNSCMTLFWHYGKLYKYCSLCKVVYSVAPGGILTEVTDIKLKEDLFKLVGNRI